MIERRTITDRAEWLSWRRANINASEYAALHGLDPYLTVAKLAAIKRGVEGLGPDVESVPIRKGVALESVAASEVGKLKPSWRISKNDIYFIDTDNRIGATPDFMVLDPSRQGFGVLQTKVIKPQSYKRWRDGPPVGYVLQVQVEMMLAGAAWGTLAPLVDGDHVFEVPCLIDIPRHDIAEQKIRSTVREFWRAFDAGEEPSIDYERDQKLIDLMFPAEVPQKILDLTADNRVRHLLGERELAKFMLADAEKKLKTIEAEIKHKIGDAEIALVDGWKISFKTQHRKAYEAKATSFRMLRADRDKTEEE